MTGERGLRADARRLQVPDLADEDDVGVRPQRGPQPRGEGVAGPHIHLRLLDPGDPVLDGVLHGDDVAPGSVERVDRGVERGRLARSGGSGHEDHAPRLLVRPPVAVQCGRFEPELGRVEQALVLVQQSEHERLAVDRREAGRPYVDGMAAGDDRDATVLRPPPVRDVHPGHDLHPAQDVGSERRRRRGGVVEDPVDPEAHPEVPLGGLEVDVRGPLVDGAPEELVDEGGHRAAGDIVVGVRRRVGRGPLLRAEVDGQGPVRGDRLRTVVGRHEREIVEAALDLPVELTGGGDDQPHRTRGEHP